MVIVSHMTPTGWLTAGICKQFFKDVIFHHVSTFLSCMLFMFSKLISNQVRDGRLCYKGAKLKRTADCTRDRLRNWHLTVDGSLRGCSCKTTPVFSFFESLLHKRGYAWKKKRMDAYTVLPPQWTRSGYSTVLAQKKQKKRALTCGHAHLSAV